MRHLTRHAVLALLLVVNAVPVLADEPVSPAPTVKEVTEKQKSEEEVLKLLADQPSAGPRDEYHRGTPRSSLLALSQALRARDFKRAENYLDLRNLPFSTEELNGAELVRKLHIIAKRIMNIDVQDLSDDPYGHKDDGLPGYRDRITTIKTSKGPVDILMQRVPRGDGVYIWKISNATVALIPALYEEFGYGRIGDKLSTLFPGNAVLGLELWQLIMLLGLFVVAFVIAYVTTFILRKIIQRSKIDRPRLQKFISGPLRFLILVIIVRATFDSISPSLYARALFEARTLLIIAVFWVLLGIVDVIVYRFAERMRRNGQVDGVVLLRPAATGIKLVVALLTIIYWLDNLGYEVTTIIAGLGVGGIAVALAAQKSLENLIGSIMIYTSQPVHVGDFCRFKTTLGTVEEIGLRSTKLRTLGRTVVHIPNALFSSDEIENLTERDKILYRTRLRLSYDVTPDKIREVLEKIRELIASHEHIDTKSSRVRFLEFGDYSQELELFIYITTRDFADYLVHREAVNLQLIDILAQTGIRLALPAHTTYISGNDAELVAE